MSIQSHLAELSRRHQALDRELQAVRAVPGADASHVAALKRKKLLLKDEIERLRH